jgi:hypothetical protein
MTLLQGPLRAFKEWLRTTIEIALLAIVPFWLSHKVKSRRLRLFWTITIPAGIVGLAAGLLWSRILWFDWLPVLVLLVTDSLVDLREKASAEEEPTDHPPQMVGAGR